MQFFLIEVLFASGSFQKSQPNPDKKSNHPCNLWTQLTYATITYFLGTHLPFRLVLLPAIKPRFGWHLQQQGELIFARWGCFIAGMSFACLAPPHHAHHVRRLRKWVWSDGCIKLYYFWPIFCPWGFWLIPKVWVKQTKRVTSWMISLELSRWDPQSHDILLDDAVMPEELFPSCMDF